MFPRWLTFITEIDGRSLKEENGVVSSSNAMTPLDPVADVGNIKIGWERDRTFIGILSNFTFQLNLFRTAAKIFRNEFFKKNIERRLFFVLTKLMLDYDTSTTPATYKRYHQPLYRGEIDFTAVRDGDYKISFSLLDGGTAQILKAKKDTVNEISMDDPEAILVKMDGTFLYDTANFLVVPLDQKTVFGAGVGRYLPATMTTRDGTAYGFGGFSNSGITAYNAPADGVWNDTPGIEQALFYTSKAITGMRLTGSIKVQIDYVGTPFNQKYVLVLNSSKRLGRYDLIFNNPGIAYLNPGGHNGEPLTDQHNFVSFDFDVTFDTLENEYFFIYAEGVNFTGLTKFEYQQTSFKIQFHSRFDSTYVKAFLPSTVNKKLVQAMTGSADKTSSSLIGANNNLALSCINAVRGLPGSVMKTTYSDFFQFCRVQMVAGLGIENDKIVIEGIEHFYNTNDIEDLGKVKDLEITVDKESLANTFLIGYNEQNYDNVNGKYEFNNSHLYESSITKVVKKFELICPYRADCFGIEILRANLEGKTTTDNDSDNDVCILDIDLANPQTDPVVGTYYNLRRVVYDNWNDPDDFGLPSPSSVFNVEIRPEKIMEKHRKWIDSMMYGFEGDSLVFKTTEKNAIKTKLGNVVTDGRSNYIVAKTGYFIPRLLSFDTDIDADIIKRMNTDPNRCFRITDDDGTNYTGFISKIGVEPDSLKEQPFALLSSADNNFLNRIR